MRKILVLLSLGLVALTGCKKDSTPSLVENTVLPPATETFAPGASVTIKGSGFTAADEIWFRAQTKATDDIQATVTKQTATEITFIVPQGLPAGKQTVLLKRDDREMPLGKITVAEPSAAKLYGIGSSDNGNT
ncbi:IPT/TIG domain-containing protein, partial [uncultured Rikenella sp.]